MDYKVKIENLDVIRGFLAITVCIFHSFQIFGLFYIIFSLIARGAVLGFFALSGYVIFLSIEANIVRNGRFNCSDFSASRFFRIMPPLFLAFIIPLLLWLILNILGFSQLPDYLKIVNHSYHINFKDQLLSIMTLATWGDLTGGGLNGPLWSLKYEIQLYVICGFIYYIFSTQKTLIPRLLIFSIFIGYLYLIMALNYRLLPVKNIFNIQHISFLCFLFGFVLCGMRNIISKKYLLLGMVLSLIMASILFYFYQGINILNDLDNLQITLFLQLLIGLALAFAISLLAVVKKMGSIINFSSYSYTLYITHAPFIFALFCLSFYLVPHLIFKFPWFFSFISVLCALLFAKIISHYIERPKQQRLWLTNIMQFFREYLQGSQHRSLSS